MTDEPEGRSNRLEAVVLVVLLCAGLAFAVQHFSSQDDPAETVDLSSLVASTTKTTIKQVDRDRSPESTTDGTVVHPLRVIPVFDAPDGEAVAKLGPKQYGDTWVPVVAQRDGWFKVLLPSRPNRSAGWVQADQVKRATSEHVIRVHTGSRTLELFKGADLLGEWTVAVGAPETPTPAGRTFVLGQFLDPDQSPSVIIPLGSHSDTLDSYGGGPGTVALHGWGDASVFGQAISHGCVRVPDEALTALRAVPIGTTVLIDNT